MKARAERQHNSDDRAAPSGGLGVGRQIAVGHLNTDGILDICVATKVGLAVFLGR